MASIFFDGDLRSGISIAIRDSKFVACFMKDDGEESSMWETDFLGDPQVQSALLDRAITFRIQAGSDEAAFLAAYHPIQAFPALILIQNGALILHVRAGQGKAEFKAGLMTTLVAPSINGGSVSTRTEAATTSILPVDLSASGPTGGEQPNPPSDALHEPSSQSPASQLDRGEPAREDSLNESQNPVDQGEGGRSLESSSSNQQSAVQRLLEERRRRLEIDQQKKKIEESAERKAKADARKKAIQAAPDSAKAKQATYAHEQQKRNLEARLERERVLRQIEQDKIERKERDERRKALLKAEAQDLVAETQGIPGMQPEDDDRVRGTTGGEIEDHKSKNCAVQVRLLDGSTIRNKFAIDQTLTDVREWVCKERSDDAPFTFKQILTPLPNRSFSISEEKERLLQLGFVPTATLVIVPIKDYTAAYTHSSPSLISRVSTLPLNTVTTGLGFVSGALGTFLGFGQTGSPEEDPSAQAPRPSQSEQQPGAHIRTLHDHGEGRDENQLYNGNHINVHPRNDDNDKDK